jgi:nucleoside-diphosphate-sugar epimerase
MSTALVTGSAGFVGRNFVKYLKKHGWRVTGWDIKNGIDARDFFRVGNATFDLVIHAAAVVGGRQTIDNNPLAQFVNFELDAGLFQWARRVQPGRIIYFSSSAAYPVYNQKLCHHMPLRESMLNFKHTIGMPDSIYGWSKVNGERLVLTAREFGIPVSVVRPFSGYGSDQDDTYPFPAFIDRALRREDPFTVWGSGTQVRDFIHIDDIVEACMRMYEQDIDGPVNLGTGTGTSMAALAHQVAELAGYCPEIQTAENMPKGVDYRVADITRMTEFCRPRVPLAEGIERALKDRAGGIR